MNAIRIVALAAALIGLFASASTQSTYASTPNSENGTVVVRIKVPAYKAPSGQRALAARPLYVSPSTKSILVLTDGKNPVVVNAVYNAGIAGVETRIHTPVGTHTFTITAYDRPDARGNTLSTGTSDPTYVTGPGTTTVVRVYLAAVVRSVTLALDRNPTLGSPAIINLNVLAMDADGNQIGNDHVWPFTSPITLTSSDPTNGTLSQTLITQSIYEDPRNYGRISITYSGARVPKIVFSATGNGLTSVIPAVLVPLAPPKAGEQVITSGGNFDPTAAFSATNGQFLGTYGAAVPPTGRIFGPLAADDTAGLVYVVAGIAESYPTPANQRFDVFQTSGAHALVDVFDPHFGTSSGIGDVAVDSGAKRLYATAVNSSSIASSIVSIYSTTRGHARLGIIKTGFDVGSLAVDPSAGRIYVTGCYGNGCNVKVFDTTAPYPLLATGHGIVYANYRAVAVDSVGGKVYLAESTVNGPTGTIHVYRTSALNREIAKIGPFPALGGIAVDTRARRLYVVVLNEQVLPFHGSVAIYGLDSGMLIGSFPIFDALYIAIAPYEPLR